jgi:hypothetical protein
MTLAGDADRSRAIVALRDAARLRIGGTLRVKISRERLEAGP